MIISYSAPVIYTVVLHKVFHMVEVYVIPWIGAWIHSMDTHTHTHTRMHAHTHTERKKTHCIVKDTHRGLSIEQNTSSCLISMVTGHMEGSESTDVLLINFGSAIDQRAARRALIVAQSCKHQWCSIVLVFLIHSEHHD